MPACRLWTLPSSPSPATALSPCRSVSALPTDSVTACSFGGGDRSLTGGQHSLGKPPTAPSGLSVQIGGGDIPLFSRLSIYLTVHINLDETRFQLNMGPCPAGWTPPCAGCGASIIVLLGHSLARAWVSGGAFVARHAHVPGWWSGAFRLLALNHALGHSAETAKLQSPPS